MKTPTKIFLMGGGAIGLLMVGYFQGYLHGVAGVVNDQVKSLLAEDGNSMFANSMQAHLMRLRGSVTKHVGTFETTVKERPFGMHLRRGSLVVEEVFPGFPAEKLGVYAGCLITRIAGHTATQGSWMHTFQRLRLPFNVTFQCDGPATLGHGPVSTDKHKFRTMVVKKPYGMNVQVNVVPRVVEVLPGSAAEAAGVKRGFVLTHVNEQPVNGDSWFDAWQGVKLPGILTFDTAVPVHKNNPFFNQTTGKWIDKLPTPINLEEEWGTEEDIGDAKDISVVVEQLPFGMEVHATPGGQPVVKSVSPGQPAMAAGLQPGDVLYKVAGRPVDSSTWFAAFQVAVPPFGLKFRRGIEPDAQGLVVVPTPAVGDVVVVVRERPFGMHVRRGSDTVQEAFPGFPAHKAGIRKGCVVGEIAGKSVSQGTWMEVFQNASLPFNIRLFCPEKVKHDKKGPQAGRGPISADEHDFRVKVAQRPFGMNIQAHVLPRVVEVLPGSPAEAAGVKANFVLKAINGQSVTAENWFDVWQKSSVGSELTFDTNAPLHGDNPFVLKGKAALESPAMDAEGDMKIPDDLAKGFSNFRCAVKKLPFGMHIEAPLLDRPTVVNVVKGSPADEVGVKKGDVLIGIAGLPVDSTSWFKAYQQASPPFGLRFRRPLPPVANPKPFFQGGASSNNKGH